MKRYCSHPLAFVLASLVMVTPTMPLRSETTNYTSHLIGGALGCIAGTATTYLLKDSIAQWIKYYTKPHIAQVVFEGTVHQTKPLVDQLIELKNDDSIDGVLLIINSGGGNPGQSETLHHAISNLAQEKPVVVFVVDCCASGAYLAASAASKIIAPSVGILGSIGAYRTIAKAYPEKFDNKETSGTIDVYEFVAGKYKQSAAPYQELDEDNKKFQQEYINSLYDAFCRIVAQARNLRLDERDEWAEGKIFIGSRAQELNLIDRVGGFEDAIDLMKHELKQRGKKADTIILIDFGLFSCHC